MAIKEMLHHNNAHNHAQDKLLKANQDLINAQIELQKADAIRDSIQDEKMDAAVLQRKDIKDDVNKNYVQIGVVQDNQAKMMDNQKGISNQISNLDEDVEKVQAGVTGNGISLSNLHAKMNAHDAAFVIHAAHLEKHMNDHAVHDAKQDDLIAHAKVHDAKQDAIAADVLVNQGKLNALKEGQAVTQDMIAVHDKNMQNHAANMDDFKAKQFAFNNQVDLHMKDEDAHMADQKHHMADEDDHMKMEKTHMKMEALHMAEAEDHYNLHDHHHHHHHHRHSRPKYVVAKLVKKAEPSFLVGNSN
jgi:hypothetical protein